MKLLIVGQGIAGTLIAVECERRGVDYHVIDAPLLSVASKVAAGIINPITGRKFVKTWMYEDLEPAFVETYEWIGKLLGKHYLLPRRIIRAIPSVKDQNNWDARMLQEEAAPFMSATTLPEAYDKVVVNKEGYGEVKGYQLRIGELVADFSSYLLQEGRLSHGVFNHGEIGHKDEEVIYQQNSYDGIIFCEGHRVSSNPYFQELAFTPAKGELFLVRIPELETSTILKDHLFITPYEGDLYWVGASYGWDEFSDDPTDEKATWLHEGLQKILATDYEVVEHRAGVRPATKYRKPLMGTHAKSSRLHLFNGLGTKGASLGPFWASHFMDFLINGENLSKEVRI